MSTGFTTALADAMMCILILDPVYFTQIMLSEKRRKGATGRNPTIWILDPPPIIAKLVFIRVSR